MLSVAYSEHTFYTLLRRVHRVRFKAAKLAKQVVEVTIHINEEEIEE